MAVVLSVKTWIDEMLYRRTVGYHWDKAQWIAVSSLKLLECSDILLLHLPNARRGFGYKNISDDSRVC
jgi:hypothetical protein